MPERRGIESEFLDRRNDLPLLQRQDEEQKIPMDIFVPGLGAIFAAQGVELIGQSLAGYGLFFDPADDAVGGLYLDGSTALLEVRNLSVNFGTGDNAVRAVKNTDPRVSGGSA